MQKKWLLLAGIFVCLVVAAWAYYQYQKPRAGVASSRAAYTLSAEKLYQDFYENEALANNQYVGKVIEVTGTVADVQQAGNTTVVLLEGSGTGGVSCNVNKILSNPIEKGKKQTIKGRCTGYLMDVNLVDAVLIE